MKKAAEYLLIFIAIQFISMTLANGVIMLRGLDASKHLADAAIGMNTAAFIIVIAVFVVWLRSISFNAGYLKNKPFKQVILCIILAFATIPPSVYVQNLLQGVANNNEELFKGIMQLPMGFVSLVFLGPITEEIVFRGAILKALSKSFDNKWTAIIISALLFAIIHFNPSQLLHAFVIGMLLGWICIKTQSIVPCLLIHIINNGTAFLFIKYLPEVSLSSAPLIVTSAVLIIISLLGINKVTARQ